MPTHTFIINDVPYILGYKTHFFWGNAKMYNCHSEKSLFTLIYELTCLWICYAIRHVSCLDYYTLDVDVSSRTYVLSNQEISIELSYIIVSMQTYSTIIA